MKKIAIATTIAAAIAAPSVNASETKTVLKQTGVFTTAAVVGAIAGGPIGMFLGAVGGAYLGEEIKKADGAEKTQLELAEQAMLVAELQTRLANADTQLGDLSQLAVERLEFQVLFHTGADQLTERSESRVVALASFLQQHPELAVRLIGRADPRGTDEYNNVLSEHRALSVQEALVQSGITADRIERRAFGALQSTAPKGDYEAYAMERRVDIEIFNPLLINTVVHAH